MSISNAIVVGGGIGGLAVAGALCKRGIAVTLLEQAPGLNEIGAGLQISPNGMAVLRALGLEAALRHKGAVRGKAVVLNSENGGDPIARLDLTRLGDSQPYYFVHRTDLIDVLAGAAKRANVTFELGGKVASVHPGPVPTVKMTDGTTRRAELIVAADGIHSVARGTLNGPDQPTFSGQVAWRATIPNTMGHPDEAHVTMGAGQHLVSYPLRGGRMINLVAVQERKEWAAEGWNYADDPAHVKRAFSSFQGRAKHMIDAIDAVTLWGLHLHPVAQRWHRDGIVMLGDAAHPTLPFLAQGANMALEDAWVLAASVTKAGANGTALYQDRREARVRRVIKAAAGNATRYHMRPGIVRELSRMGLRIGSKVAPGRMIGAYDWLYRHDVTR